MTGGNFKRKHPFSEPRTWRTQITTGADRQFYIVPWASPFFGRVYLVHLVAVNTTGGAAVLKTWDEHIGVAGMAAAKRGDNANDNLQLAIPAAGQIDVQLDEPYQAGIAMTTTANVQVFAELEVVGN
jgi:hypothetical protein